MKIVCMSDTHNRHDRLIVPDGDLLIHAGDAAWNGTEEELEKFASWFGHLPHPWKVMVPGNHDDILSEKPEIITRKGISLLVYETIEVAGVRLYGGPFYTVSDARYHRLRSREKWAAFKITETWAEHAFREVQMPIDILVTHRPPYGILDLVDDEHGGCHAVRQFAERAKPRLSIFGHVHEGRGQFQTNGLPTVFVNAASHTDRFEMLKTENPFVIEME